MDTSLPTIDRGHRGPSLTALGVVYLVLFIAGLVLSRIMAGVGYPPPFSSEAVIVEYFRAHPEAVRLQAFFMFGSSVALGVYVATATSRLQFLGVRVAGVSIALFGGLGASLFLALSGMVQWVLARPEVTASTAVLRMTQDVTLMTGGTGYVVFLGLFLAGVSVPALLLGLLPRWLCMLGIALGALGELAALSLIFFPAMFLLPLVRFPAFGWLILCGARLPHSFPSKPSNTAASAASK